MFLILIRLLINLKILMSKFLEPTLTLRKSLFQTLILFIIVWCFFSITEKALLKVTTNIWYMLLNLWKFIWWQELRQEDKQCVSISAWEHVCVYMCTWVYASIPFEGKGQKEEAEVERTLRAEGRTFVSLERQRSSCI